MKNLKKIMHRLLFPGTAAVIISVPVSACLLAYTFLEAGEDSPVAYVSYVISAYSLTIVCANLLPMIRRGNRMAGQNPYIRRYLEDIPFKMNASLHFSLAINLVYSAYNAVSGFRYHSVWFGTLAAYYILLSVTRYLLVRYAHRHGFEGNGKAQWRRYRMCGVVLMLMNAALAGVVVLVLRQNRGFHYGGSLIYVMAMYAFYVTIMGGVNLVRYRKYNSPVISAAKAVNMAAALVSMLSLETAMLARFDDGSHSSAFRQIMIGSTGGAVCAIVVGMGLVMIIRSTRQLKKMRNNNSET